MIRIVHVFCAALLVGAALLSYGVKEEVARLADEVAALKRDRVVLQSDIAVLEAEWAELNSPDRLRALADGVFAPGPWRTADGRPLTPIAPDKTRALARPSAYEAPVRTPRVAAQPNLHVQTGDISAPNAGATP